MSLSLYSVVELLCSAPKYNEHFAAGVARMSSLLTVQKSQEMRGVDGDACRRWEETLHAHYNCNK